VASPSGWGLVIPLPVNAIGNRRDATALGQKSNRDLPDLVVLDRITDPGNAGAIIRSAAAAGIGVIWCVGPHVDIWSPKVLRSAMGGHFALRIIEDVAEADALSQLAILGPQLLATALTSNAISLYAPTLDLKQPTAWVFGQEAHGVSPGILKQAKAVRIPQDACVESLNVAASAAVCLFEMRRQRLAATKIT